MEKMGQIIYVICCISMFSGILTEILPQDKFKKIYRFSVGVIFLALVVTLFSGEKIDLSTFTLEKFDMTKEDVSISTDELILSQVKENSEVKIKNLLEARGISCDKVIVTVHKNDGDIILISEVEVITECSEAEVIKAIEIIAGEKIPCKVTSGEKKDGKKN